MRNLSHAVNRASDLANEMCNVALGDLRETECIPATWKLKHFEN